MFTKNFNTYACVSDTSTCEVDGFDVTATIYHDDSAGQPDENDDGFWPSLDPKSAGWIGPKSKRTLARHMKKAQAVMDAWLRDDWHYVGVAVTVSKNDVELTGKYSNALWGVECNYPGSDNSYLREVANELIGEALDEARATLTKLAA